MQLLGLAQSAQATDEMEKPGGRAQLGESPGVSTLLCIFCREKKQARENEGSGWRLFLKSLQAPPHRGSLNTFLEVIAAFTGVQEMVVCNRKDCMTQRRSLALVSLSMQ